ncbi:hypothetical protein AYK26_00210 [Euryarchaeota archaeon SM23-78]|nr:MAG: hypothetical protein AYK26_00210 [Euryarchaeota archaeon SM23-78]MBW3001385.1 hypothetical protein [Candidatus Woesearchaeota archaeon]
MNKKIFFLTGALLIIFLISFSTANAYTYKYINPYLYPYTNTYASYSTPDPYIYHRVDTYPVYHYYEDDSNLPLVTGPFPRYYLAHQDLGDIEFLHDDFNHFDEFIGYKDLDIYYPNTGEIHILRNPNAREPNWDLSHIPEGMKTFGEHVHGWIPDYGYYVKHYNHEHEWEMEYDYDYYGYFTPYLAYRTTPYQRPSCQSISACQYRYCSSCYG